MGAIDPEILALKDALAALQIQAMKRLLPLANEVYDEVPPTKYKWPLITKYDRNGYPFDHLMTLEIECGSIASNDKFKL